MTERLSNQEQVSNSKSRNKLTPGNLSSRGEKLEILLLLGKRKAQRRIHLKEMIQFTYVYTCGLKQEHRNDQSYFI